VEDGVAISGLDLNVHCVAPVADGAA